MKAGGISDEAVEGAEQYLAEGSDDPVGRAERDAADAGREVDQGFPTLSAVSIVLLWSRLEAAATDAVVRVLETHPEKAAGEAFSNIKIPVGEFLAHEEKDRLRLLVDEFRQKNHLRFSLGVGGLEPLFDAVGFGGEVEDDIKRNLLELSQIRNVVVHRGGVADRRLRERCPWVRWEPGEVVQLTQEDFGRHAQAVVDYVLTVGKRASPEDWGVRSRIE